MELLLLKAYAISLIGTPYLYGAATSGGDDPILGFDCSGLVSELMRAAGVVPYNFRASAQALFDGLPQVGPVRMLPKLGDLSFYGKSVHAVSHVGFCLDAITMLEAGGGDSETTTPESAAARNAFVRLRPIRFRKDFLGVITPRYPESGGNGA